MRSNQLREEGEARRGTSTGKRSFQGEIVVNTIGMARR